ncbi:LysR family transcriptional regulator [Sinirhodobacter populi]|uniref:LysR family transcriptional regulator n=2 Tax=Paenirhodobacter populi TaxID=2306993 RepID=A0A443K2W3_9RHOB|nr:LysR family transcriptional regulator [Sinirhodobacter populi]
MNFRRAAARLNMTQPPLTRQIQLLEHELGVKLLERSGRNVQFTTAGAHFYLEAQDVLRRAETAAQSARRIESGECGSVSVGCFAFANAVVMPQVLIRAQQMLPQLTINLREMGSIDQSQALASGLVDLGIMRYPRNTRSVRLERILCEKIMLAVPRNHPLALRSKAGLMDLNDQPFVMYSAGAGWYSHGIINGLLTEQNIRPCIVQHVDSTLAILAMVNAGLGLALVPQSAASFGFDNVTILPVELPKETRIETYIGWHEGRLENPAVLRVKEMIVGLNEWIYIS